MKKTYKIMFQDAHNKTRELEFNSAALKLLVQCLHTSGFIENIKIGGCDEEETIDMSNAEAKRFYNESIDDMNKALLFLEQKVFRASVVNNPLKFMWFYTCKDYGFKYENLINADLSKLVPDFNKNLKKYLIALEKRVKNKYNPYFEKEIAKQKIASKNAIKKEQSKNKLHQLKKILFS